MGIYIGLIGMKVFRFVRFAGFVYRVHMMLA